MARDEWRGRYLTNGTSVWLDMSGGFSAVALPEGMRHQMADVRAKRYGKAKYEDGKND